MKKNGLNKRAKPYRGRARPHQVRMGMVLAFLLATALLCIPESSASKPGKKGEVKTKAGVTSPKPIEPVAEVKSLGPQTAPTSSASGTEEKGTELTWQVISAGAIQGGTSGSLELSRAPGYELDETIGQLAVGSGSSNSYDMNSGFLPGFEEGSQRGDANGDDVVNVGDIVFLVSYLYKNGPAPDPIWVGDCNCDEVVNVGDIVFLVSYLYKGGPEPLC